MSSLAHASATPSMTMSLPFMIHSPPQSGGILEQKSLEYIIPLFKIPH